MPRLKDRWQEMLGLDEHTLILSEVAKRSPLPQQFLFEPPPISVIKVDLP